MGSRTSEESEIAISEAFHSLATLMVEVRKPDKFVLTLLIPYIDA